MQYNLPKWYVSARKNIDHNFTSDNFESVVDKSPSPCGNFTFVVEKYQKPVNGCDYTYYRGIVYSTENKCEVISLHSNAHEFWHCWVEQNDKLYLLCNEDPQGYTVVDVNESVTYSYVDPKAKEGWGFSWKKVLPSPDGKFLAVQGDYMESAKEVALYDLSNVQFPLRKIKRLDVNLTSGHLTLKGWKDGKVVMEHVDKGELTIVEVNVY